MRWGLAGSAAARFAVASGKIVGILFLIAAVGSGALYLVEPWLESRGLRKVDPQLSTLPLSLPNHDRAILSGRALDCYGFRLLLPRKEIVTTYKSDSMTLVLFRNGALEIPNTSRHYGIFEFLNREKQARALLRPETLQSKFKLMQAAMLATPEQVKWWRLRSSSNERIDNLLLTKLYALTEGGSGVTGGVPIYTIAYGEFRGFQFGSPGVAPYDAHLDLFDGTDRYFALSVTATGHGQVLTQEEINAVAASIQSASAR